MKQIDEFFNWAVVLSVGAAVAVAIAASSWVVFDTFRAWACGQ